MRDRAVVFPNNPTEQILQAKPRVPPSQQQPPPQEPAERELRPHRVGNIWFHNLDNPIFRYLANENDNNNLPPALRARLRLSGYWGCSAADGSADSSS